jgi:D-3-phosphoglycerate dehydrogenase
MKSSAIIGEQALISALRDRRIAGAALDVFTAEPPPAHSPLLQFENGTLTPHFGAGSV